MRFLCITLSASHIEVQGLREEVRQLKQSVKAVTNASPERLMEQILAYASRPLTEFNKYEVLEMLETLHNKAADRNHDRKNYYRLVHQSAREKVELSKDHFRDLVMRPIRRQRLREGPGYRF